MKEKTVNIDNFIGVYDNYILPQECEKVINMYEAQNKFNNTVNRIGSEFRYLVGGFKNSNVKF